MTESPDDARSELLARLEKIELRLLCGDQHDRNEANDIGRAVHFLRPAPVTQCEAEPVAIPKGMKPIYVKRWRTLILVGESIADEVRAALHAAPARCDAVNAGLRQREALAITRLRATVSGEEFEWEVNGGSPFDDAKFLVDAYDRALVALWKIAGLIDSEDGEPLDDAIRIARAALSPDPGTVAVEPKP